MFYWLIELSNTVPGFGAFRSALNVFRYITFRTGGAMVTGALFVFLAYHAAGFWRRGIIGHPTGCGGNPMLGEQFLRLVFEEIHSAHHFVVVPADVGCNTGHIGL